jgi:hypothetical protein
MLLASNSTNCHLLKSVNAAKRDYLQFARALGRREEEELGVGSDRPASSTAGMKPHIYEKISSASTLIVRRHMWPMPSGDMGYL